MKTKEIIQLSVALVIFAVAGFVIYSQTAGGKKAASGADGPKVEVVSEIPRDFNSDALAKLSDSAKVRDFYTEPNLNSGLGNPQLFGPLR